ncbi:hypothetical protein [Flavobacterium selenitireducens]|uniref:hypothetical protein n=1 Tax=Flavobacterium selenitireducens TaxID=2722704 RepID=UPI00168B5784|nr:hypothetical protein [Flavobacterium selenitireducens]MBD3583853.1 hypothetical protein [Flavobacterium selenitireducens]
MKIRFAILIFVFGLVTAQAQMRRSGTGINALDQQHDMQGAAKPPSPEEQLSKTMAMLTTELSLNGLQEAAIRNVLHDQQRKLTALRTDSRPEAEKQEEAVQITTKSDNDIKALLDPDQLKKYDAFKEQMRSGKKKKKEKKKEKEREISE